MRLIDASKFDLKGAEITWLEQRDYTITAHKEKIYKIPTVDAAPVKHGRWEGDETCDAYDVAGVKTWAVKRKCSACGFVHKFIEAHMCYEFCPNCGAKMDLEG